MDLSRPIFPAPSGYLLDLANPQRSGVAANIWVGVVGLCVSGLFMGTRIYTKAVLARSITSDDGMSQYSRCPENLSTTSVRFEVSDSNRSSFSGCLGTRVLSRCKTSSEIPLLIPSTEALLHCYTNGDHL
jgi:hypothetical protein